MVDELAALVRSAEGRVDAGYYDSCRALDPGPSLGDALVAHSFFPVIAEIKIASPSAGRLSYHHPARLLADYISSRAAALSVLTEPERFGGSLDILAMASGRGVPVLMKDFVVSERQIDCAASLGSSAVLLIQEIFGPIVPRERREELIDHAHRCGLEVLLEAGSEGALTRAISSNADLLGINQRDLGTFAVDTGKAARLLPLVRRDGRLMVVMSGIEDLAGAIGARDAGADAVLVGSALAAAPDPGRALLGLRVGR